MKSTKRVHTGEKPFKCFYLWQIIQGSWYLYGPTSVSIRMKDHLDVLTVENHSKRKVNCQTHKCIGKTLPLWYLL